MQNVLTNGYRVMKLSSFTTLFLFLSLLSGGSALAFETDQYNLPPIPLADIGDEVSERVEAELIDTIRYANAAIERSLKCIELKAKGCQSAEKERAKLASLRSPDAIAKAIYFRLGDGDLITTKFGNWMRSHKFQAQPDRFKPGYGESIFKLHLSDYLTMSATVKMFGAEFGIDKLEHFFQQGHKYYQIEKETREKGAAPNEAARKAIDWGKRTERTYFGLWISGVYSNADLYANYAGMKFFQGLTRAVEVNGKTRPASLALVDGRWTIADGNLRANLLKPFMTNHMNEALNPSAFRLTLVRSVRRAVKKHACPDWRTAYPQLTRSAISDRSRALELWNGVDYGFTKKERIVSIADACFEEAAPAD
ncbi:MAG TPA: hypothetical protein VNA17_04215 [Pyrinomonadaceae bacterium]|nr:hypothetical protein [Pyrinomonadaceae bacterium]